MPEQEVQKPLEAMEGDAPKEGQLPQEKAPPSQQDLEKAYKYWNQLDEFCQRFPDGGTEIHAVVSDYLSGKRTPEMAKMARELSPEPKMEVKPEAKGEIERREESNVIPLYENRIQKLEEKALVSEIDLTIKKMAEDKRFGPQVLEKQAQLEKSILELGLVPSLNAKTMTLSKAFELAWKDLDYDNQLTRGQNQVISEIEEKRGFQGPQLQKTNVAQVAPVKPKTFKEALLQAEKDLGYTIEEAKEALYRR